MRSTREGAGRIRTVTGSNPAAGAQASDAVPTNAVWDLLTYSIVLVTDATSATRIVGAVVDDGVTANRRAVLYGNQGGHTASLTRTHLFAKGEDDTGVNPGAFTDTDIVLASFRHLPVRQLLGGYRIRTFSSGFQAGDDFAAPIFQVAEWLEE